MATKIQMPKLGLTMTEGTITEWVAAPGQVVTKGSVIMTIETDKVQEEVEADGDGILFHSAEAGDTLEPGEIAGWLLAEGESPPDGGEVRTHRVSSRGTPGGRYRTLGGLRVYLIVKGSARISGAHRTNRGCRHIRKNTWDDDCK